MNCELPQNVEDVANVIGRERALFLVGQLPQCGKRSRRRMIYIPTAKRLRDSCQMVQILGWDDARALSEVFGGEILELGTCRDLLQRWRDLSIRRLYRRGCEDLDQLAEWFGLTRRYIRVIVFGA